MWLFTPFGFFSIVAHPDNPDTLIVRARARADLVQFAGRLSLYEEEQPAIIATADRDYAYRMFVPREDVRALVDHFIEDDLTYNNFKGEVAKTDMARAHLYHDVWEVMHRLQAQVRARFRPAKTTAAKITAAR